MGRAARACGWRQTVGFKSAPKATVCVHVCVRLLVVLRRRAAIQGQQRRRQGLVREARNYRQPERCEIALARTKYTSFVPEAVLLRFA